MKIKTIKKNKISINKPTDGKHSFLFWMIIPIVVVWLSVSYLVGFIEDKPIWLNRDESKKITSVDSYFKNYGSFTEDLDQPFVTFWFDDAWLTQFTLAYPILKENNFPGVIAVPVDAVETPDYMNWAQLRTVQKDGWEITSHSMVHDCSMQNWTKDEIVKEYKDSKYSLWKNQLTSDIFVTPCGVDSKVMRDEAAKMFMGYRTVDPGFNDPKNLDFYKFKVQNIDDSTSIDQIKGWIDEAAEKNLWVILVFHKIGEGTGISVVDEFTNSEEDIKETAKYVKSKKINVVVPAQMMASQSNEE